MSPAELSFEFRSLRAAYETGVCTPRDVAGEVLDRIERDRGRIDHVWLSVLSAADVRAAVDRTAARRAAGEVLPLYGIPFGVKDNIDVAGLPTTAACPEFAYVPETSAHVVQRLVDAGAIVIGKTNLDQFATGLVGVRSPYGVPTNPFDPQMIPGGSSSGSAVAVAAGHVSFALGTDTAGSGRVPASFNNVVGLKPSRGALSTRGVVPACRSLDCVSVFALTVPDACSVAAVGRGWDPLDPFSRADADAIDFASPAPVRRWRLGVPRPDQLAFFDEGERGAFARAVARARELPCTIVEVDFRPFREAGELLYGSSWVTERRFAAGELFETRPGALLPVVADILRESKRFGALDVFTGLYRLRELRQSAVPTWSAVDALLLPTVPAIYRVADVLANPRALNTNLGIYTTFVNLMDLAAVAVPAGFRTDGLPSGITLIGPRGSDPILAGIARTYHQAVGGSMGATGHSLPPLAPSDSASAPSAASPARRLPIVVVGAHLTGHPLNHQLTTRGGTFVRQGTTAPRYRLFALRGTVPPKPGLVRVREGGLAIEIEVWSLDEGAFGAFVAAVPRPMCIGSLELDDGSLTSGFLCEPEALADAVDISHHGGWRAYLQAGIG